MRHWRPWHITVDCIVEPPALVLIVTAVPMLRAHHLAGPTVTACPAVDLFVVVALLSSSDAVSSARLAGKGCTRHTALTGNHDTGNQDY